jgi:hypothetical protein
MNRTRPIVAGHRVKLICSCVRNADTLLPGGTTLAPVSPAPRAGDLVLVQCLDSTGAYDHVEDQAGRAVKLYRDDLLVVTLATRRSGTNLVGEVPAGALAVGDQLHLVAQGGLVATCVAVPEYYGSRALEVSVVGFPATAAGRVVNIGDAPVIPVRGTWPERVDRPVLFVCGTSAESGKTAMACNINIAARWRHPGIRTAAIKACGTGRAADYLKYVAANYDVVTDFVDAGMPSTYDVPADRFRAMLHTLIRHCAERADLVVVEIGGDLIEARAPEALEIMAELDAHCVLMVNDAMGAMEGLRRLRAIGRQPLMIGTYRQNPRALADRLDLAPERVASSGDPTAHGRVLAAVLGDGTELVPGEPPRPAPMQPVLES